MQSLRRTIKDKIPDISHLAIFPVLMLAVSAFIIANTTPPSVLAESDVSAFPAQQTSHQAQPDGSNGFIRAPRNSNRLHYSANNSGAPYIVNNGVQMYEVNPSESGGWPTRVAGDDTYGNGELLAVSVQFSESVVADNNMTFRVRIGSSTRDLSPVSTRDDTVIFATLIRSSDRDTDGIWIGDNTATLDHNDADAITSTGASPRNANWTHSSLGTQSSHKVKGNAYRPKVTEVSIASTPQYGTTYVRNEAIKIQARFNRSVRTTGHVSARIKSEALGSDALRFAQVAEGSGTSRLVFQYTPLLDIDPDGIAIPRNALAENGDVTQGASGGGKIVGASGGLHAKLDSSAKAENSNHKIDVRLVGVPDVIAAVNWAWEDDSTRSSSIEMDFNINEDPGHFSEDHSLVLVMGWGHIAGQRFAVGLRTDVDKPSTDGSQGKGIVFNRWGTTDTSSFSRTTGDGWTETGTLGGDFISVRRTFDWGTGNYSVRIAQDGDDDDADDAGGAGRWFGMWITDKSNGNETKMGSVKFPYSDGNAPTIRARDQGLGSLIAITGASAINATSIPVFEAALALPDDSAGDEPNAATVNYSLLGRGIANANVSHDEDTGKLVMRVGGSTDKSTVGGTTLTGLETPELTASFLRIPSSHNGSRQFVFRLHFNEEFPLSYKTLRDHAFTVDGGRVVKASRVYTSSNMRWEIRIQPDSDADVTVVLPATQNCWPAGGICTADGRELSGPTTVTIPGPNSGN